MPVDGGRWTEDGGRRTEGGGRWAGVGGQRPDQTEDRERRSEWLTEGLATRYPLLAARYFPPPPSPHPKRSAPFSSGNRARVLPCQLSKYATRCCNIRREAPRGTPSRMRRMLSLAESSCASTRRSRK